jgi:hypothetical protein
LFSATGTVGGLSWDLVVKTPLFKIYQGKFPRMKPKNTHFPKKMGTRMHPLKLILLLKVLKCFQEM